MRNERGSIMVATMGFVLIFTLLGTASIYFATTQNEAAEKQIASTKAFWLAEAGIQKTLWEYKQNNCRKLYPKSSVSTSCDTSQPTCKGCTDCGSEDKCFSETISVTDTNGNVYKGDYDIVLKSANSDVTSTGKAPFSSGTVQRTVQWISDSKFSHAVFAKQKVLFTIKTMVDSYNSNIGSYGSQKAGSNGDIGSNDTGKITRSIEFQGDGGVINGDVGTRPGGTIDEGQFKITGSKANINEVPLPSVVVPTIFTGAPGKIDIDNKTTTITDGIYKYDLIKLNKSTLNIQGNVKIYLEGNVNGSQQLLNMKDSKIVLDKDASLTIYTDGVVAINNNSTVNNPTPSNPNPKPEKFIINSTNRTENGIIIFNEGKFYGAVYAPNTDIEFYNKGEAYGSFVGEDVTFFNEGKIHYDEALAATNISKDAIWQEL